MKIKFNKYIVIVEILLVILSVLGFKFFHKSMPVEKTVVQTEIIKKEDIELCEIYQGYLISRNSVILHPQVLGQISQIKVKAGDRVNKGDVLIVIDPNKQEAVLNSYKVKQAALQSTYKTTKIQYERYKDLYAKKTVSKQDYENYANEYKKAKSALDENTANIKEQSVELGYHSIKAPFSGVIGDIPVKIGEYVTGETVLLSVTQNNPLELNIGVSADKTFDLKKGLAVQVFDNNGKVVANSTLSFISPKIDSSTQTILTKSILKNDKEILRADQSIKSKIIFDKTKAILIPVTSVAKIAGQDFVFIAKEEKGQLIAKQVPIVTGNIQDGKYIIKSGLKDGDNVVIKGIQKLYDGALIEDEQGGK